MMKKEQKYNSTKKEKMIQKMKAIMMVQMGAMIITLESNSKKEWFGIYQL